MIKLIPDIFMINKCKYFIFLLFFILSCTYGVDKLVIINNTNNIICYQVLIKNKEDNSYYHAGIGKEIEPNTRSSPIIKQTILESIDEFSNDRIVYVIYYKVEDRDSVHENLDHIIGNKKVKVDKYSLKELDSLNWQIEYRGG